MAAPTRPPRSESNKPLDPNSRPRDPPRASWIVLAILVGLMVGVWLAHSGHESDAPLVDYSMFYARVEQGQVASVKLEGQTLEGRLRQEHQLGSQGFEIFRSVMPTHDDSLSPLLRERGVAIRVAEDRPRFGLELLLMLSPWLLLADSRVQSERAVVRRLRASEVRR